MNKKNVQLHLLSIAWILLVAASLNGQDSDQEAPDPEEGTARERIIINVEYSEVSSVAKAVQQLSKSDLRLFVDEQANRLIVDGPKNQMPSVVGLIREIDRPVPQIKVSVVEVALELAEGKALKSGPTEELQKELETLTKAGKAKVVNQLSVEVVNNTTSRTQVGAARPSVTGSSSRGKNYQLHDVGTVFECIPRIASDAVLLSYTYEKSDLVPSDDEEAPKTQTTLVANSIISVGGNKSVVTSGLRLANDNKMVQWKLILTAEVVDK